MPDPFHFPISAFLMPSISKELRNQRARELTGQRRNRVFVYDAYLDILNEGGQPL